MARNGYLRLGNRKTDAKSQFEYDTRTGKWRDRGTEDLVCTGSQNLPPWGQDDPARFWSAADKYEVRNIKNPPKNLTQKQTAAWMKKQQATKCKTIIFMIPSEFSTPEQQAEFSRRVMHALFPHNAATWSVHNNSSALTGKKNPHGHAQICERVIDPNIPIPDEQNYFKKSRTHKDGTHTGGYNKDPTMSKKGYAERMKKIYADVANQMMQELGYDKSHYIKFETSKQWKDEKARGVRHQDRHLGAATVARAAQGRPSAKMQKFLDARGKTMRKAETEKEFAIADQAAAPATKAETLVTIGRYAAATGKAAVKTGASKARQGIKTAAAVILHPRDVKARNAAIKAAARQHAATTQAADTEADEAYDKADHWEIQNRYNRSPKRKTTLHYGESLQYTGDELSGVHDGVVVYMGYDDDLIGNTPGIKGKDVIENYDMIEHADPGKIRMSYDESRDVVVNEAQQEIETQRWNYDKTVSDENKKIQESLTAHAARNGMKQVRPVHAAIPSRSRGDRQRTEEYFEKQDKQIEAVEAEEAAEKEILQQKEKEHREDLIRIADNKRAEKESELQERQRQAENRKKEKSKSKSSGIHRTTKEDDRSKGMHM